MCLKSDTHANALFKKYETFSVLIYSYIIPQIQIVQSKTLIYTT